MYRTANDTAEAKVKLISFLLKTRVVSINITSIHISNHLLVTGVRAFKVKYVRSWL